MKIKEGFVLQDVGGHHMAVSPAFQGLIRNNETADFVFRLLMQETTEEAVAAAVAARYDAPPAQIAADVHHMIGQLRAAGLLDE